MSEANYVTVTSDKSKQTALILCAIGFVGLGGLHDFYLGRIGSGIIKLITLNWLIFGTVVDLIKIANGTYKDGAGAPVVGNVSILMPSWRPG
jgi:TM2 domain-containing membrane protein YozV